MDALRLEPRKDADLIVADEALRSALHSLLVCTICRGELAAEDGLHQLRCGRCGRTFPVVDGIPVFVNDEAVLQDEERRFRDAVSAEHIRLGTQELRDVIAQHHCLPVMRDLAGRFRAGFVSQDWILDIGVGYGWHWQDSSPGARVLGIDLCLGNLQVARRLLGPGQQQVVLVCVDAASLPIRERSIAGLWSVQAFQHFPAPVLRDVLKELDRVLDESFAIEIHNLNPAWLLRAVYRLFGKRLHRGGKTAHMELNRLSADEWNAVWQQFKRGKADISCGYSELFFHPDLRLRPRRYPVKLEQALAAHAPGVAALFARQVRTQIRSKPLQASA